MKAVRTSAADIALRSLTEDDRRRVIALLQQLDHWEVDAGLRRLARALPTSPNVFVLKTTTDLLIFFQVEDDRIEVLDIAARASIERFGQAGTV